MRNRQIQNRLSWSQGAVGIALLLSACSQPQVSQTSQESAPETEEVTQVDVDEDSEENIGIERVTLASLEPKSNETSSDLGIVLPEVRPLDLPGNLAIAGSATVFRLTEAINNRFIQEGYPGTVKIASIGTESGFELFCQDTSVDIVNAHRPIKDTEIAACQANGREPINFEIAKDALVILVSSQNDFLPKQLSREELIQVFTSQNWSDVNSDWPDIEIQRFVPRAESPGGLLERFVEVFFNGDTQQLTNASNTVLYNRADQLHSEALTNPNVIGVLGHAYYKQNEEAFKQIDIEDIDANSEEENVLSWPVFIYSDTQLIREHPEVRGFINYYLTNVKEEILNAGYFPASPAALEESKQKLLQTQE
ncbi:MAG: phosphate ABC transporter substrate-binding protein [Symploca sp. SIO2G7]|nr:phosphate ABC transporter substrate-binding protein [Symploca sp. SIO2G7]